MTTGAPTEIQSPTTTLSFENRVSQADVSRNGDVFRSVIKRCVDIIVSSISLLVISVLILLLMTVIFVEDGGPVIYGHQRVGQKGRSFQCLKLRSMRRNANVLLQDLLVHYPIAAAEWRANRKLRRDPRVTRTGRFLRATSLVL